MKNNKESIVRLNLNYTDAHILTIMLQDSGYPHILKQVEDATRKATAFRLSYLIKHDIKEKQFRSVFYRLKNWKSIRAKYT